jgi:glycosyltransferase involved in cell wall biosynthesis
LVCVGRIDGWKGRLVLARAAQRQREAGVACKIVLVGDGPFRNRVEDEVGRAALEGAITVLGWVSGARVREEMLTFRALVLPCFYEGLPTVIMGSNGARRP